MIQRINAGAISSGYQRNQISIQPKKVENKVTTMPEFSKNFTATSLVNAYQAFYGIVPAKTVSFTRGLAESLSKLNTTMSTCKDEKTGNKGEVVGTSHSVNPLINTTYKDLPQINDAIKTDVLVASDEKKGVEYETYARTQLKRTQDGVLFQMAVRQPLEKGKKCDKSLDLQQKINILQDPYIQEKTHVLNTKGRLMPVLEDGNNVLMTYNGTIEKKDFGIDERLKIEAKDTKTKEFVPFEPAPLEAIDRIPMPSIGKGTEIVIGMEEGRFVPEIIDSIEKFTKKVQNGEIVLEQFKANPEAENTQLVLLAGGFGSRAEYTNASSDGIFHGKKSGAQSTKGVFKTATGLTPMETTFISLHNAGLLDCSQDALKIGDNIKFYLNKSGVNKGNGGFTVDLYNKMDRAGRKSITILPNDSMSRMSVAARKMSDLMNTGKAAVAMISKAVPADEAKGNFGIMKLSPENEILAFAEKPKTIPEGFEINGNCLTNTFQFAVSKEAMETLATVEPYLPAGKGKEPRDWSSMYMPVLMALSQLESPNDINDYITTQINLKKKEGQERDIVNIPEDVIADAKGILGDQKVYSVPTEEPWADVGSLTQLYDTTIQIAKGDFALEPFERKHVLDSVNPQTGLVASSFEQLREVEDKYDINGKVMVVPKAPKVNSSIVDKYLDKGLITINPKQV